MEEERNNTINEYLKVERSKYNQTISVLLLGNKWSFDCDLTLLGCGYCGKEQFMKELQVTNALFTYLKAISSHSMEERRERIPIIRDTITTDILSRVDMCKKTSAASLTSENYVISSLDTSETFRILLKES